MQIPNLNALTRPMPHPAIVAGQRQSVVLRHLLSGAAIYATLKKAIEDLVRLAPKDHDVWVEAFDVWVLEVRFVEPHTFLLRGFDQDGHHTSVVAHFSQLVARVVYQPQRGPERVITGFAIEPKVNV